MFKAELGQRKMIRDANCYDKLPNVFCLLSLQN